MMKKALYITCVLTMLAAPMSLTSCSTMAGLANLTGVNIDSLPGVKDLAMSQEELVKKHSPATIMILESQKLAIEALGMREDIANIEAQINHLKANPNDSAYLTSTIESLADRQRMINDKIAEVKTAEDLKVDVWKQSCKKLNEAMQAEAKLAVTLTALGIKLTKAIKEADSMQKALLATKFRPIVYFLTTLPKDYALMKETSKMQDEVNTKLDIKLPVIKNVPASIPNMDFSF